MQIKDIIKQSELEIYLHHFEIEGALNKSSKKEIIEVYKLVHLDTGIDQFDLSEETQASLNSCFKTQPISASILSSFFETDLENTLCVHISRQIWEVYFGVLEAALKQQQYEVIIDILRYAYINKNTAPRQVKDLYEDIVYMFFPEDPKALRKQIYSALLSHPSPYKYSLELFSKMETEVYKKSTEQLEEKLPWPFAENNNDKQFWNQYYNFTITSNQHFLEYIMIQFFQLAKERDFENIKLLLRHFSPMKPILMLMTWDKFSHDIVFKEKLLNAMWDEEDQKYNENNLNKEIVSKCNTFAKHVHVARWCSKKLIEFAHETNTEEISIGNLHLKNFLEMEESNIANKVAELLNNHSLIYIMHFFIHKVNPEEFIAILREIQTDDDDSAEHLERDLILINSYFCIKEIIFLFGKLYHFTPNDDTIASYIERSRRHLEAIKDGNNRMVLIEHIYSLLFTRRTFFVHYEDAEKVNVFLADPSVVTMLLEYLCSACDAIRLDSSQEGPYKALKQKLAETLWRANFLKDRTYFYDNEQKNYVNLILASPDALLATTIKQRDYVASKEIISFFNLQSEMSELAHISEVVQKVYMKLDVGKDFDMKKIYPNAPDLQLLLIYLDIFATHNQGSSENYIQIIDDIMSRIADKDEDIEVFRVFFEKAKLLLANDINLLNTLLNLHEVSLEDLKKYLIQKTALKEAADSLHVITSSKNETVNSEQILRRLTLSLSDLNDTNGKNIGYINSFIKQLLILGMTIVDDQIIGKENFFDILQLAPKHLISDLVFKSRNFKKAESLSNDLHMNLVNVILESIGSNTPIEPSKMEKSLSFENHLSKSLRKSYPEELRTTRKKYSLNMDIVEYLRKKSPLLATLACVMRSPTTHFDPSYFKYALSASKQFAPLHNWTLSKVREFSLYYNTFLKDNYDELDFVQERDNIRYRDNTDDNEEYDTKGQSYSRYGQSIANSLMMSSSYYPMIGTPTASMGALGIGDDEDNPLMMYKSKQISCSEEENGDYNLQMSVGSVSTKRMVRDDSRDFHESFDFDLDPIDQIDDVMMRYELEVLFENDQLDHERSVYLKIVDKLILVGKLDKALDVADNFLPGGAPDNLLRLIIKENEQDVEIWQYIRRLHDKELAAQLTLEYHHNWSIDTIGELADICKSHMKEKGLDSPLFQSIDTLYKKVEIFKQILALLPSQWTSWQQLNNRCESNLESVIDILLNNSQYDVANRLAAIFDNTKIKRKIEEKYIIYLLTETHDTFKVKNILLNMGDEGIKMAESLLEVISTNKDRLFLIQYLMDMKPESVNDNTYIHKLSTKELGVKILMVLKPELQKVYQNLIGRPMSIIESLFMSEQTSVLASIFKDVPQVRNDELVIKYATKALDTSHIAICDEQEMSIDSDSGKLFVFDDKREHFYSSAPSYPLAASILDLCYNNQVAAQMCLTTCDQLSLKLYNMKDRLDTVKIMQQLIYYAKVRLTKDGNDEAPHLLQLCDTLLGKTELLLQLIFSATPDIAKNLSLSSLADPQRVRIIRDKLIELDMLDLALIVANKCGVEAEPIWAAKGLQLLQAGKYQDAKQLFKYCMVSNQEDDDQQYRTGGMTGPKKIEDNSTLLNKIISVLESQTLLDSKDIVKKYSELNALRNNPSLIRRFKSMDDANDDDSAVKAIESISKARSSESQPGPKRKHTLDSIRYMQCVFYLQKYGSDELLMQFWLRHNLIEDALRHLMCKPTIEHKVFMCIVRHALSHNLFLRFKDAIHKMDPSLKKWREPLLSVCKELNSLKMYQLLIEFQLIMKDYVRAGLTCVKIFTKTENLPVKLHYLNSASKYFSESLEAEIATDNPISKADVSKYIRTAKLQFKVTNYYYEAAKEITHPLPHEVSLFGALKIKMAITENLIVNRNFDLGFQIIQEYRLSASEIYRGAIEHLARSRQTKKIDELLKNIRALMKDSEIDLCILSAIEVYVKEFQDYQTADEFVSKMKTSSLICEAFILCKQLKNAYFLAVKINDMRLVRKIRDAAKEYDMKREYELCEKFLSSKPQLLE